ncbi:MAG: sugar phosphate isomerase/epimerase [Armatimonadota bacterium]|nr:sugar phosphate isomerase/epimerase [Armatimonadota bacterium]MDR7532868.1 sugar phosphate isomerase/epimerase [Armatimonadota bacterium]MDR7535128.1 sugar phosphate isomerase/epimerase [Armatimonadota bacterium]
MPAAQLGVSQYTVLDAPIAEGLDLLVETGLPGLELFMEGTQWWDGGALAAVEARRHRLAGPLSVHPPSWDINIASYTRPVWQTAVDVYSRAIEWAGRLGATYVVAHIGWRADPHLPRRAALARAEDALQVLVPRAAAAGVVLAVENVGWHGLEVCDQAEFTALVHRLPAGAGALLDVGHARLAGWDVAGALRDLAPRLVALHLHDNHGARDEHLPIGQGDLDWTGLLPRLRALPAHCQHVLEYAPGTPLERVRQDGALLGRLLAPPE